MGVNAENLARIFEQYEVMAVLPGSDAWFTRDERAAIANALRLSAPSATADGVCNDWCGDRRCTGAMSCQRLNAAKAARDTGHDTSCGPA